MLWATCSNVWPSSRLKISISVSYVEFYLTIITSRRKFSPNNRFLISKPCVAKRSLTPSSTQSPTRQLWTAVTVLCLRFSSQSFQLKAGFIQAKSFQLFLIYLALQTLEHLTGQSKMGCNTSESISESIQRGRDTSLWLLATVMLIQCRGQLAFFSVKTHCWLTVILLFTMIPRAFPLKLDSN